MSAILLGIGLQAGGYVYGPLGAGDIIPALLSPGEFVLNRNAVAMIGSSSLHWLNNKARGYQSGGLVKPEGAPRIAASFPPEPDPMTISW